VQTQTFHFEVKDLLTQFIAAFDDIIINRYDKNRNVVSKLQVRYVYSPKQRVIYDLVNKAQNITIPVVSISISNISRDESRVFNKIGGYFYAKGASDNDKYATSTSYKSPVPVNIGINMSILTKFQSDMDQILSNFIPYNNPYIILSWKLPDDVATGGFSVPQEIRSEVLWSGDISMTYPTDINASEKYRVAGDTTFTIKGWLFPAQTNDVGNIFYIDTHFYNSRNVTLYNDLSGETFTYPVSTGLVSDQDNITINGYPQITNTGFNLNS